MEVSIPKIASVLMAICSFLRISSNTIVGKFFRWVPFNLGWFAPIYDFIVHWYALIMSFLFVMFFLKWTRNFYVLGVMGILAFLFMKFLLQV